MRFRLEYVRHHDLIGQGETVRQFLLKTFRRSVFDRGSRITHNRDPGIARAQRRQRSRNRRRMMGEIIDDRDPVHLRLHFQPPLHALESLQRSF